MDKHRKTLHKVEDLCKSLPNKVHAPSIYASKLEKYIYELFYIIRDTKSAGILDKALTYYNHFMFILLGMGSSVISEDGSLERSEYLYQEKPKETICISSYDEIPNFHSPRFFPDLKEPARIYIDPTNWLVVSYRFLVPKLLDSKSIF